MGWTPGTGLGKQGNEGRTEAPTIEMKRDTIGLGGIQYIQETTKSRKKMKAEIVETEETKAKDKVKSSVSEQVRMSSKS